MGRGSANSPLSRRLESVLSRREMKDDEMFANLLVRFFVLIIDLGCLFRLPCAALILCSCIAMGRGGGGGGGGRGGEASALARKLRNCANISICRVRLAAL